MCVGSEEEGDGEVVVWRRDGDGLFGVNYIVVGFWVWVVVWEEVRDFSCGRSVDFVFVNCVGWEWVVEDIELCFIRVRGEIFVVEVFV